MGKKSRKIAATVDKNLLILTFFSVVSRARDLIHRLLSNSRHPADLLIPQHGAGHQGIRQVKPGHPVKCSLA
jgi:hypothetical protein